MLKQSKIDISYYMSAGDSSAEDGVNIEMRSSRSDSSVSSDEKWMLGTNANGYYIYSYTGTSRTLTCPTSNGDNILLGPYYSINTRQNWLINKVTSSYHGVTIYGGVSSLVVGDSATFGAAVYSTYTDTNGQDDFTWSVTNGTGSATISSTGKLTGVSKGTVTVKAIYTHGTYSQWTASCTVNVNYGWPLYNKPSINARTSWGARAYIESRLYERERDPERIIFHHSADKFNSTSTEDIISEIKRIQNLHMDEENKCDIAYHFIIDPCGNIWEGALIDEYQRGHADGYFDDIGVLILGDFEPRLANLWNPDTLNTNQMNAAIDLAKWLCFEYDLPINTENDIIPIATHNNVNSGTVCPGENATQWIEVTLYNNIKQWYLNGAY